MLTYAIVSITLALVFYTTAVWMERKAGRLKGSHLALFWLGFAFDTLGTTLMGKIAGGAFQFNLHGITGLLAIGLMLLHAVWGTAVYLGRNETWKKNFHKFSVAVWAIWLIPYLSGLVLGMRA
ncbi:MAG: HsmA family protein [Rectinema sp.]